MKRRDFVTSVLVAGAAVPVIGDAGTRSAKQGEHSGHGSQGPKDKSQNHQVSFGHWEPTVAAPLDRMAGDPNPRTRNGHFMTPSPIKVRVGDTVTFAISGFHNLMVYGPGTQPADIDRTLLLFSPPGTFPPLIDDPNTRVYRGLDPRTIPASQDRVEAVAFNDAGRYLVICGVLPHFFEAGEFVMFGYVDVKD
jgi:plastocyanin